MQVRGGMRDCFKLTVRHDVLRGSTETRRGMSHGSTIYWANLIRNLRWWPTRRGVPVRCCARSEEHTSELQSRFDLVCRLLLEKKKQHKIYQAHSQLESR